MILTPGFEAIDATRVATTFTTTRDGGVSKGPYATLNVSYSVGDERRSVDANRALIAARLRVTADRLVSARQKHGISVWQVDLSDLTPRDADILVTTTPSIALMTYTADCTPIVLLDPNKRVAATVHAGRRGVQQHAAIIAVTYMVERLGCALSSILAGLGPSIAREHYEIDEPTIGSLQSTLYDIEQFLRPTRPGHAVFDLVGANVAQLSAAGLNPDNIIVSGHDTFSQPEHYFSARRQQPFGCMGTGIMLL